MKEINGSGYRIYNKTDSDSDVPFQTKNVNEKDNRLKPHKNNAPEEVPISDKKDYSYGSNSEENKLLSIDIVLDVICPWCYIGKHRLDRAMDLIKDDYDVRIRWHAFELNPNMPLDGMDRKDYRAKKFGSWKKSEDLDKYVTQVGNHEGIVFEFDKIKRTPNTLNAHRLIRLAQKEGMQKAEKVIEGLYHGYFAKGLDIGDRKTLVDIATYAGMDALKVSSFLEDNKEGLAEVKADEAAMAEIGVNGVPHYIINNKYSVSGAQDTDTLISVFQKAVNENSL